MPLKIQPIRIQESRCISVSIPPNLYLPIDQCNSTVSHPTLPMEWYKIVIQPFLVIYQGVSHSSLVFSWYTHEPLCVYQKIQVTRGIFHGIPLESVAYVVCTYFECLKFRTVLFSHTLLVRNQNCGSYFCK